MMAIRPTASDQLAMLQPLFMQVFEHSISLDLLRWKYAAGRGESWAAWADDAPILHCGLWFREVLWQERSVQAMQLVDLMAPAKQTGLSRKQSPFAALMHHLLADSSHPQNPQAFAFGFPSPRSMRLGEHLGFYRGIDQIWSLRFDARATRWGPRARVIAQPTRADLETFNALWLHMSRSLKAHAVGTRDARYLLYRYFNHPEKQYTVLLVESTWRRRPIGWGVFGPGTPGELLDVGGTVEDLPDIVHGLQRWLASRQYAATVFSVTEYFARLLAGQASACGPTEFRIMANALAPAALLDTLQGRWWLTWGDADYR